jgi:hypothetical protein
MIVSRALPAECDITYCPTPLVVIVGRGAALGELGSMYGRWPLFSHRKSTPIRSSSGNSGGICGRCSAA